MAIWSSSRIVQADSEWMTGKQEIETVTGRGRKSPSSLPTNRPDLVSGCVLGCLPETFPMPFVDVSKLPVAERLPGWYGRYFHSPTMTFAHYDFVRGSSIHEHFHSQEEVYEVIEGELEVTIDGVAQIARAGLVAIVPGGVRHSVKALTDGRAIIVDYPRRPEFK